MVFRAYFGNVPIFMVKVTFERYLLIRKGPKMTSTLHVELNLPWQALFKIHVHTYFGTCENNALRLKMSYITTQFISNGFEMSLP